MRLRAATAALLAAAAAQAGTVTLLYDDTGSATRAEAVYHVASWNPDSGLPDPGWSGYARRPMFDDGQHGDGAAGDGVWGARVDLAPQPMHTFKWAVDLDADAANGWLGLGDEFRVTDGAARTVWFFEPPEESKLSRVELEAKYGLDLSGARAPVPVRGGEAFAFTAEAPDAEMVFLPGSFNAFADNKDGAVVSPRFRMYRMDGGVWLRILPLAHGTVRYKFAARGADGRFRWFPDPHVAARDGDENSLLDLRALMPERYTSAVPGRALAVAEVPALPASSAPGSLRASLARTWVRPGEPHRVTFTRTDGGGAAETLRLRYTRDLLRWEAVELPLGAAPVEFTIETAPGDGPALLVATLGPADAPRDRAHLALPVAENPFDDLRYGFYANWDRVAEDYAGKAELNARLLLNAMEYYDYFPAHGDYDPSEEVYEFEPFYGRKVHVADIRGKIEADRARGILAVAYIAAYATSKSVFDAHPFPMTNEAGENLVFNGRVLPEREADGKGERKWFWLMAIARDSPWHPAILAELRRALLDEPEGLLAFDGFEIDSYGHAESERYFSEGSAHRGRLLADVIAEFIEDVWRMAHEVKEHAAVSFNCVCEFGMDRMYHITDFLFVENWAGCKPGIEETVDICHRHRAPARQRAVLKIYPADAGYTDPAYFPPDHLRLMMGMCVTGGGSLMIAGEPDERTGQTRALNTLYYPDNVALPEENVRIIEAYNRFDALLYGFNHGRSVANLPLAFYLPGCVARGFENERGDVAVLLLHHGEQALWSTPRPPVEPLRAREVAIDVPAGREFTRVLYLSPDSEALQAPVELDFERTATHVRAVVPELHTTGALILVAARGGNPTTGEEPTP
ncbi:MAG: glycoside hydrolase family 66 protein [Candidatus Sumerlaeia bacterium]|nr:glycoside hydrolase family 66 protein [Candidatus Sumerlaeia bacterium]